MESHGIGTMIGTLIASAFTLAIISVVLSNKANTSAVIQSGSSGLGSIISAAEGPVTGNTNNNLLGNSSFGNLNSTLGSGGMTGGIY